MIITNTSLNKIFRILNLFIFTFSIFGNIHSTNQQNTKQTEQYQSLKEVRLDINIVKSTNKSGEFIEKNILTQKMLNGTKSKYIIQYDYDLDGATITIPEGCVLEFQGGMLKNGTIIGNRTFIEAGIYKIFNNNLNLSGTWNVREAFPEWCGAKGDNKNDDTESIQKALNNFNKIVFKSPQYLINIEKGLYPKSNSVIILENTELIAKPATVVSTSNNTQSFIFFTGVSNVSILGFGKAVIDGRRKEQPIGKGSNEWSHGLYIKNSKNIKIENISINNCHGDGICEGKNNYSVIINNTTLDNNFRNGIALCGGEDIIVSNCIITKTNGGNNVGLDIEPDESSYIKNVTVTNCTFNKNGKGISIASVSGEKAAKGEKGYSPNIFNVTVNNCSILNCTDKRAINLGYSVNTNISNCVIQQDNIINEFSGVRLLYAIGAKISGISIKGAFYGIASNLSKDLTIENCMFSNCHRGLQLNKTDNFRVTNNEIHDCKLEGIRCIIEDNVCTSIISNNKIYNTPDNAIYIYGSNVIVSSNIIYNSNNGIHLDRAANINTINNIINSSNYGIYIISCKNINNVGNIIYDNNKGALYITDSSNLIIKNNISYNNWLSVIRGKASYKIDTAEILVVKDVDNIAIEGNDISIPHKGCGFAIAMLRGSTITNHIVAYNRIASFAVGALNTTANLNTLYNIVDGNLNCDK